MKSMRWYIPTLLLIPLLACAEAQVKGQGEDPILGPQSKLAGVDGRK